MNYEMSSEKAAIVEALYTFLGQRPGFEPGNYAGAMQYYRAESRQATKDRHDAEELLRYIVARPSINADDMAAVLSSGRLNWNGSELEYCTGQYFCVEFRPAACRALSTMIWNRFRDDNAAGGEPAKAAAREFSRAIVKRWFR
jgi:hypothetical protein